MIRTLYNTCIVYCTWEFEKIFRKSNGWEKIENCIGWESDLIEGFFLNFQFCFFSLLLLLLYLSIYLSHRHHHHYHHYHQQVAHHQRKIDEKREWMAIVERSSNFVLSIYQVIALMNCWGRRSTSFGSGLGQSVFS